jgi:hypothetical protein
VGTRTCCCKYPSSRRGWSDSRGPTCDRALEGWGQNLSGPVSLSSEGRLTARPAPNALPCDSQPSASGGREREREALTLRGAGAACSSSSPAARCLRSGGTSHITLTLRRRDAASCQAAPLAVSLSRTPTPPSPVSHTHHSHCSAFQVLHPRHGRQHGGGCPCTNLVESCSLS